MLAQGHFTCWICCSCWIVWDNGHSGRFFRSALIHPLSPSGRLSRTFTVSICEVSLNNPIFQLLSMNNPSSDLPVAMTLSAQIPPPRQGLQAVSVGCGYGGKGRSPVTALCCWRQPTGLPHAHQSGPLTSDGAAQGAGGGAPTASAEDGGGVEASRQGRSTSLRLLTTPLLLLLHTANLSQTRSRWR